MTVPASQAKAGTPATRSSRRVPLRENILTRILATSVLIALCSGGATAWLAVTGTTRAIHQEQGQSFADYSKIYDELLGYAATHPQWNNVDATVRSLASRTGQRITLTTEDRRIVVSSEDPPPALPSKPSAVVNPLAVDAVVASRVDPGGIDGRAVGPFLLPEEDRSSLRLTANEIATCARKYQAVQVRFTDDPAGRPVAEIIGSSETTEKFRIICMTYRLDQPTRTEATALAQLTTLTNTCLERQHIPPVKVNLGFTWTTNQIGLDTRNREASDQAVQACLDASRREQLRPLVAPAALLFVAASGRTADPVFALSRGNTLRLAGTTALILTLATLTTVLLGIRLTRPLRALTLAASDPTGRVPRLPIRRNDEIGRLTAAFNDLSERREATERQRRTMVSDIAHELATPLTNIRAWLQAAKDGIVDPDPELLDLLSEESILLQHIIDDLRDLAAADAGNLRLHREQVFVNDLLDQVVTAHQGRADAAKVALSTQLTGDPEILVDPTRLRQAVGNLLSNAIRHSPPDSVVTIRSQADRGELVIDVADTGSGITAENLSHVFERFWRADRSRNRHTGGSGLGLAIVRKLMEAHGGTVTVRSRPGEGSTFTLRLPT